MANDRTRNTIRSIGWGSLNIIVTLAVPFFTRTCIILYLGAEFVGLGSLFTSICGILNLVELGFGSAITFSMYKPIAEQDDEKVCALLRFARIVYFLMGCIVLAIGLALMPFLPQLMDAPPEGINIYLLFAIYLGSTITSYMMFSYRYCLIIAMHRNDVYLNITTTVRVVVAALQIYVLLAYRNFYLYCLCTLINNVLTNVFTGIISTRMYPHLRCRGKLQPDEIKSIKKQVGGLLTQKMTSQSRNAFDSIVISRYLGLKSVGMYNNYFMIMNSVSMLLSLLVRSMEGGMGNSVAVETKEKNYKDMRKINFIFMWISSWFCVAMFVLIQPFMELWTGSEYMFSLVVAALFSLYLFVQQATGVIGNYVSATGSWWHCKTAYIIEAMGNLVLNFLLGYFFGVIGVLVATILTIVCINIPACVRILHKFYFQCGKKREIILDDVYCLLAGVVAAAATWLVCSFVSVGGSVVTLIIRAAICCVLPNVILLLCLNRTEQFKVSVSWIKWKIANRGVKVNESM